MNTFPFTVRDRLHRWLSSAPSPPGSSQRHDHPQGPRTARKRDAYGVAVGGAPRRHRDLRRIGPSASAGRSRGSRRKMWIKGLAGALPRPLRFEDRDPRPVRGTPRARRRRRRNAELAEKRPRSSPGGRGRLPVLMGFSARAAANPTLIVNWTFIITFLVGHRLMKATIPRGGRFFAGGIGVGVFKLVSRSSSPSSSASRTTRSARFLRRSTVYARDPPGPLRGVLHVSAPFFAFEAS